ncbi:hypothetical protein WP7S18E06_14520 [Aeromonas hydrophila]|uniref:glycosyltransferase n=1 Tax=Aeromonas hydrophila TaxID=644 RepID=UPI0015DC323B|nr:glycosyltransferase [Aeromonas hydrophila]BBT05953.1 hypothetical protein WP7S18E06_14520 [Aeromonas hydrophila]
MSNGEFFFEKPETATVVISSYNQHEYISQCLDSILSQSVSFKYDIIISDDNSTDGSRDVIMDYMDRYPDVIIVNFNKTNLGATGNYFVAHGMATGDIIFHMDGDDVLLPGKMQAQFDIFHNNDDVNVCFHRAQYFNDSGDKLSETGSLNLSKVHFFCFNDLARWGTIAVHSSYAFRRRARSLLEPKRIYMEWYFAMNALKNGGRGAYLNDTYVKYRKNDNGDAYSGSRLGRIKAYNAYINDLYEMFSYESIREDIISNAIVSLAGMIRYNKYINYRFLIFIIKHIKYFNVMKILETLNVRRSISPQRRVFK